MKNYLIIALIFAWSETQTAKASEADLLSCVNEVSGVEFDMGFVEELMNGALIERCTIPGLTLVEKYLVHQYTGDGGTQTNRSLRLWMPRSTRAAFCVNLFQFALSKFPKVRERVWRGVTLPPVEDQRHVPGAIVTYTAFTSTSRKVLSNYSGTHTLWIESLQGRDISDCSAYRNEDEVLFAPDTRFKVNGREVTADGHVTLWLEELL